MWRLPVHSQDRDQFGLRNQTQARGCVKSVSGRPREVRGGSMGKGRDLDSGHTCLSGATGPEPRCVRDHGTFGLTAYSIACTPRAATGKATTQLCPCFSLRWHRVSTGPFLALHAFCLVSPHMSEFAQERKHLPPARGERTLHTGTHMC